MLSLKRRISWPSHCKLLGNPQKNHFLVVRPLRPYAPPTPIELSGHIFLWGFFLELQKVASLLPSPPLSGRATKKIPFFEGFPNANPLSIGSICICLQNQYCSRSRLLKVSRYFFMQFSPFPPHHFSPSTMPTNIFFCIILCPSMNGI